MERKPLPETVKNWKLSFHFPCFSAPLFLNCFQRILHLGLGCLRPDGGVCLMFTCLIIAINLLKPPPQNYDILIILSDIQKLDRLLNENIFTSVLKSEHLN